MTMNHDHMNMTNKNTSHEHHDMSSMNHDHMDMSSHEHTSHAGMDSMDMSDMKRRFWWAFFLMLPIIIITPFMGIHLPFTFTFPGSSWVSALLSTLLYFIGSKPFWDGTRAEFRTKKPAMMSLITVGLNVTFWYSIYAVLSTQLFHVHVMDFFWEFATLNVIMLLGHRIEMSVTMQAGDATAKLRELMPNIAHVKHDDMLMDMPIDTLKSNMIVRVLAGESFPADGTVVEGVSQVDESLMTGESRLVEKKIGSQVVGGTINGNGTLDVKLTTVGDDSFIGQLKETLLSSQDKKSRAETLADKVAAWLFWVALLFAIGSLLIWTPLRGLGFAVNIAATVLVIACPHALGLAVPLVINRTKAIAAQEGILIKNRKALVAANHLKFALMDKTGTLTTGKFTVQHFSVYDFDQSKALGIMSALDQQSTHPLAQSIVNYAKEQHAPKIQASHVENIAGYGVRGKIDDQLYTLASAKYLKQNHITFTPLQTEGSISYLLEEGRVIAAIAQGDHLKESAPAFIRTLLNQGITPVMITGDNELAAKQIADELKITDIHSQVSPQDKINLVSEYQQHGTTMMIGDGINDAPALAQANLSIAIGVGTEVAHASADAILIADQLSKIIDFINLAKRSNTKQVQNLWWGASYNIIAIPLAAGVLAFAGIMLNPMIAALIMSLSTIIVAINALLLKH
ncbi:copper-translocating P-type ATPase [Leuconostoc mesenteroides]|uniref:copper-translocating P-type ATPase n=1 Tax=Leuconostoc mesenteroides TaxID=1245 RepID=UPI0021C0AA8C|nr:copper-translocating P-type ATPase [Leuconostoc mesenteroides]MCT8384918.1 cadmium-translocating P-type ATPase [Leuconostoc mesenteroides]